MTQKEFLEGRELINQILSFAIDNKFSSFYKKKYENTEIIAKNIKKYEDFSKIPFLTKDEILECPIEKRIFVPEDKIFRYSASSGTTNNKKVLVVPHSDPPDLKKYLNYDPKFFKKNGIRKILALLIPNSALMNKLLSVPDRKVAIVPADTNRLPLTAMVATEIAPEAIISTPTLLYRLIQELKTRKFDFKSVKFISLGGEFTTTQRYEYFKTVFPNALFKFRYGNSEIGNRIGFRCEYLADENPSYFHANPEGFVEIINSDDNTNFGEIVYTHLVKGAFPMIRYRTGDMATIIRDKCPCGRGIVFDVGGRKDFDVLKVSGALIHTAAISTALREFNKLLKPEFQMHVYESIVNNKLKIKLDLWLEPKDKKFSPEYLAPAISEKLFLSPDKTLEDYVKLGLFTELGIKKHSFTTFEGKSKNIISHLS